MVLGGENTPKDQTNRVRRRCNPGYEIMRLPGCPKTGVFTCLLEPPGFPFAKRILAHTALSHRALSRSVRGGGVMVRRCHRRCRWRSLRPSGPARSPGRTRVRPPFCSLSVHHQGAEFIKCVLQLRPALGHGHKHHLIGVLERRRGVLQHAAAASITSLSFLFLPFPTHAVSRAFSCSSVVVAYSTARISGLMGYLLSA